MKRRRKQLAVTNPAEPSAEQRGALLWIKDHPGAYIEEAPRENQRHYAWLEDMGLIEAQEGWFLTGAGHEAMSLPNPLPPETTGGGVALGLAGVAAAAVIGGIITSVNNPRTASDSSFASYAVSNLLTGALFGMPAAGVVGGVTAIASKPYRAAGVTAAVAGIGGGALLLMWGLSGLSLTGPPSTK